MNKNEEHRDEELPVVVLSNTVVQIRAMMVIFVSAPIANFTMSCILLDHAITFTTLNIAIGNQKLLYEVFAG